MYQNGRSVCHTHFWTIKSTIWVVLQNIRKKQCFPSTICVYWFLFGRQCVGGDFCLHNLTLPSSCLQRATINRISSDQHTWHHVIANSKQVACKWNGHWVMCLFWAATSLPWPILIQDTQERWDQGYRGERISNLHPSTIGLPLINHCTGLTLTRSALKKMKAF